MHKVVPGFLAIALAATVTAPPEQPPDLDEVEVAGQTFPVRITETDGSYVAECPTLTGMVVAGGSRAEALVAIATSIEALFRRATEGDAVEHLQLVPDPTRDPLVVAELRRVVHEMNPGTWGEIVITYRERRHESKASVTFTDHATGKRPRWSNRAPTLEVCIAQIYAALQAKYQ